MRHAILTHLLIFFSLFFSGSQFCACFGYYVSSAHSATIIPYYCTWCPSMPLSASDWIDVRTIEVMYLSVRRSKHALLAIGFFALFVVIFFSTLLSVISTMSRSNISLRVFWCRYFAERGTWDNTLDTFINTDGDPTQFAASQSTYQDITR